MIIVNQDRDQIHYNLSTNDIFYKRHFVFIRHWPRFMGWNMYGKIKSGRVLLGTFNSKESCRSTLEEMKQYERAGLEKRYIIPDDSDGIDEYEGTNEYVGIEGSENV